MERHVSKLRRRSLHNKSLKTLDRAQYNCAFYAAGYETTLDNLVEVTFTESPRVRKIAAQNPDQLSGAEYYRQIFWSSAIDLPTDLDKLLREVTLETVDLPPGERAILSITAAAVKVGLWHVRDMPTSSSNVRSQQYTGRHLPRLSSSQFDPRQTLRAPFGAP
jgi:hypothetical protein